MTWNTPVIGSSKTSDPYQFDEYWLAQAELVDEYVAAPHSQDLDKPLCDFVENGQVCREAAGHSPEHPSWIYDVPDVENVPQTVATKTIKRTKQCSHCKSHLPLSDFHKHATGKYGVGSKCAECRRLTR